MKISFPMARLLLVVPVVASSFLLSGCGKSTVPNYKVGLEMWGSIDDSDSYQTTISAYQQLGQSHIGKVSYRKMTPETYRDDLLKAFAEGNGPDIFLIRSSWLPLFKNLIAPAPSYETTEKEFHDSFVDVAADDLVVEGKVYGVPLSVDSLALYYNKDLFNAAGITTPPSTWDDVVADVKLLNAVDSYGNIRQSGIALGTAKNINRSTDILLAMATQYGLKPSSAGFSDTISLSDPSVQKALSFYSGFAGIGSDRYSWNANQHYSIDDFYEGNLAMMVNYSWQIDTIRKKNPKLNFGVAPLPQIKGGTPSNYANYWVYVVAKDKKAPTTGSSGNISFPEGKYNDIRVHESWQFLHYLAYPHPGSKIVLRNALATGSSLPVTVSEDPLKSYFERTGHPAARRDIVETQKNDPWLSPFAYGNLIAKDWRIGEVEAAEGIIADAIDSVNRGGNTVTQALSVAASQVEQLQRKASRN
ncbi:MAG TPA: extracellular solute-binding protein [Candidatus Fimivivens sp.]|nr:extracellular solute-binding protein [Candidatus Fimivivens sp.]